jgi:hypothetical protein
MPTLARPQGSAQIAPEAIALPLPAGRPLHVRVVLHFGRGSFSLRMHALSFMPVSSAHLLNAGAYMPPSGHVQRVGVQWI